MGAAEIKDTKWTQYKSTTTNAAQWIKAESFTTFDDFHLICIEQFHEKFSLLQNQAMTVTTYRTGLNAIQEHWHAFLISSWNLTSSDAIAYILPT